jgi:hypothetical protein
MVERDLVLPPDFVLRCRSDRNVLVAQFAEQFRTAREFFAECGRFRNRLLGF